MPQSHLVWLEPTEGRPELDGLWRFLQDYLRTLAADRYTVSLCHLPAGSGGSRHPATRLLEYAAALATAEQAAEDADALVFACWAAPVLEARALLPIPVTGLTEATATLGAVLARRAAVVTVARGLRAGFEEDLARHGLLGGLLDPPIWWLDPASSHEDVLTAVDRPGPLIDRFDAVAQQAVDRGADAILVGCGYLGPLFSVHGYHHVHGAPDVPVIDCCRLAFELVDSLSALQHAGLGPSRRAHPPVPPASEAPLRRALDRVLGGRAHG